MAADTAHDQYKVRHLPSGELLVTALEIASTGASQRRGLLGRDELAEGGGMLFPRVWSIHTLGMRFAIDVLFTDADLYVRKVIRDLVPTRVAGCWRSAYCLEMPAGTLERIPVVEGDGLRIEKHVTRSSEATPDPTEPESAGAATNG